MRTALLTISGRGKPLTWGLRALLPLLLVGGALPPAQPVRALRLQADDTTAYTFERTYKAGDVDRYRMVIKSTVNSQLTGNKDVDVLLSILMKETTKELKPDGGAVLQDDLEQAYAKIGDQEMDATSLLPGHVVQTRDKQGRIVESKIEGGASADNGNQMQMFAQQGMTFYPPKPVKVGESWKISTEASNPAQKGLKVVGTATLVGTETLNGVKTLKVKAVTDTTGPAPAPAVAGGTGDLKVHFDGVGNIDPASGKLVHMTGTADGVVGPLGASKMQLTLDLLKADENVEKKPGK